MTSDKELCERLREKGVHAPPDCDRCLAADRIEALTAERDAAVALAACWKRDHDKLADECEDVDDQLTKAREHGEARATAAIVAYGRDAYLQNDVLDQFLSGIERNEHLPANPLDT